MPRLSASTTYPGGTGRSIRTTGGTALRGGGGYGGGPGGGGPGGGLGRALGTAVSQRLRSGALENQARQLQLTETARGFRQARAPKLEAWDSQTGMNNEMRRQAMRQGAAQTQMLEAQANAATRLPPRKLQFGPNVIPGYIPDPNAMSGAQRQMFLPQESGFTGPPPPSDVFAANRASMAGQQEAQMGGIQQMMGLMQQGFVPGQSQQNWGWAGPQSPMARAEDERERRRKDNRPDARMFNPRYGQTG